MRVLRDVQFALRVFAKSLGFTGVALLTTALGIGTTTAIFSVVDAVLLRPLPYTHQEQLVHLWETNPAEGEERIPVAPANYLDWRQEARSFSAMGAYVGPEAGDRADFNLMGADQPERLHGAFVSPNLFSVLGVRPSLGRTFAEGEEGEGKDNLVVLSHSLWRRHFAADSKIVGRNLLLNGRKVSVVGVMPEGFSFPTEDVEIWVPFGWDYSPMRQAHIFQVVARLAPGVTIEQARAELTTLAKALQQMYPDTNANVEAHLLPLHEWVVGDTRRPLLVLSCAVGLVLLIACTNVANLLLSRSSVRQREIAIRIAIGAGRSRLISQLLVESLVLSLLGGAAGLLLASWGIQLLRALQPEGIPRLVETEINPLVLAFAIGVSLLTGLLFGLVPALQMSQPNLVTPLKESSKGDDGNQTRGHRFRNALVVLEVALSLLLVIAAALLIQSFRRLQRVDPGFDYSHVLTASVSLPRTQYSEPPQVAGFYSAALENIAGLPGVQSVGATSLLPLRGLWWSGDFTIEGEALPPKGQEPKVRHKEISPRYFETLRIPLIAGRSFQLADDAKGTPAVIVNQTFAQRYLKRHSPIGLRIKFATASEDATWRTIVGVSADERQDGVDIEVAPEVYQPYTQRAQNIMSVVIRTEGDPSALARDVRREINALDSSLPVYDVRPLEAVYRSSIARRRFTTLLLSSFAAIALVLSAVGIYGLVSYSVSQRRQEIGIRMALGAQSRSVLRLVVLRGMAPVILGLAVGLAVAFLTTRLLASLLYEVEPRDGLTFLSIPLLLATVALLACLVPAWRASRLDPGMVLR